MYRRILLIDDEPAFLESLALYLEDAGHEVLTAVDASHALEVLDLHQPDAIVCDMRMPGMQGLEFYHRVRQNLEWHSIPFILLTGAMERALFDHGAELGIRAILRKPFEPEDLLALLSEEGSSSAEN